MSLNLASLRWAGGLLWVALIVIMLTFAARPGITGHSELCNPNETAGGLTWVRCQGHIQHLRGGGAVASGFGVERQERVRPATLIFESGGGAFDVTLTTPTDPTTVAVPAGERVLLHTDLLYTDGETPLIFTGDASGLRYVICYNHQPVSICEDF